MARSKYINTFDTTAEYNNYIESAFTSFPNVGYDKEADKVNIVRTSPNDHLLYGEVVDPAQALPTISLNNTTNTPTLDELNNAFYLDSWSNAAPTNISFGNTSNIKSIKKMHLDTSNVTNMNNMFNRCSSLTSLDLSNFNTSKVTDMSRMFSSCSSLTTLDLSNFNTSKVTNMEEMFYQCITLTTLDLSNCDTSNIKSIQKMFYDCRLLTDVYITVEATLMKLTNNLTSEGTYSSNYIPSNNGKCTIHYNGVDYKWQNSKWTPQS